MPNQEKAAAETTQPILVREYKYEQGCENKVFCFHCKQEVKYSTKDNTFWCGTCKLHIAYESCQFLHSGSPSDIARGVNMRKVIFFPKP